MVSPLKFERRSDVQPKTCPPKWTTGLHEARPLKTKTKKNVPKRKGKLGPILVAAYTPLGSILGSSDRLIWNHGFV